MKAGCSPLPALTATGRRQVSTPVLGVADGWTVATEPQPAKTSADSQRRPFTGGGTGASSESYGGPRTPPLSWLRMKLSQLLAGRSGVGGPRPGPEVTRICFDSRRLG